MQLPVSPPVNHKDFSYALTFAIHDYLYITDRRNPNYRHVKLMYNHVIELFSKMDHEDQCKIFVLTMFDRTEFDGNIEKRESKTGLKFKLDDLHTMWRSMIEHGFNPSDHVNEIMEKFYFSQ